MQTESQLQEDTSRVAVGSAETQVKSRFGASFSSVPKVTFGSLGYRSRAQSVLHCHSVLALRHGPWTPAWTGAVQNESQPQEDTSRVAVGSAETQVKSRFAASFSSVQKVTFGSLGYGPRAQSVLHCHGVLALRHGPWTPAWTGAVQNESQLQEDTSMVAVGSAETQVKSRVGASFSSVQKVTFGSLGYGPRAQSVLHCHGVLALRHGPWTPAWTGAVQTESQLQEDTSGVAVGSAETQVKSRFGASF